jgi:hypothetical protein
LSNKRDFDKGTERFERRLPRLHPWWQVAYAHGKANESWFAVKFGSEEHKSWNAFFGVLGWMPGFLRTFKEGEATLPCQWPDELAKIPPDTRPRNERRLERYEPPRLARPSLADLKAKYGENWGLHPKGALPPSPWLGQAELKIAGNLTDEQWDELPNQDEPPHFKRL